MEDSTNFEINFAKKLNEKETKMRFSVLFCNCCYPFLRDFDHMRKKTHRLGKDSVGSFSFEKIVLFYSLNFTELLDWILMDTVKMNTFYLILICING